jgi:hypothetical protein
VRPILPPLQAGLPGGAAEHGRLSIAAGNPALGPSGNGGRGLGCDREANLVEAGVRWQLTLLTVVSAGAGRGFLDESPNFRFLGGIQHTLTLFPLY